MDAVSRRLSSDVRVRDQIPSVRVEQGVVTLSGNVVDFRAASAAERDARGVLARSSGLVAPPAGSQSVKGNSGRDSSRRAKAMSARDLSSIAATRDPASGGGDPLDCSGG